MLKSIYIFILSSIFSIAAFAQSTDSAKPAPPPGSPALVITGSADVYYRLRFLAEK